MDAYHIKSEITRHKDEVRLREADLRKEEQNVLKLEHDAKATKERVRVLHQRIDHTKSELRKYEADLVRAEQDERIKRNREAADRDHRAAA